MWRIILKDLMVQKSNIFIILFLCISISGTMYRSPGIAGVQLLLGVYFMLIYANSYDFKYNGEIMINSLPINRKEIVLAKYLSAIVYALIIMVIIIPESMILYLFNFPGLTGGIQGIVSFLGIVVLLLSLYISIYLPLYYRLGYMRSRWANFISMFVIFGLIGAVGQLTKMPADELETTSQGLEQLIMILNGYADPVIYLMMLVVGIVLLVLSFKVSVRIYKNKDF
ncbi:MULTISPECIES: ABC-2 transporter permease [unclassified Dehalobacter]|uniref:ABC-2 transporter permease n=1 Tax=unclassified Dehalobacter TaxID=2635733 RepID=UPI000376855C|nr:MULTISPECIES: ABC-2 transporter permease [unclassified Dehalobacter]RJE47411.1 hypothetical protein A7K50_01810 [Dehalobacter sp. MCB1]TCX48779.1 ABC-2 transporter permease [Dehalobacter sp. 14DCB1]TCX56173.1 ABC-2 transporter permease [Dehalobacter sp. 12DCB1]